MERHPGFAGGLIWEWCDHAVADENGRLLYAFDFGEKMCGMHGLVFHDRRPHTKLLEYKNVLRPARVFIDDDKNFQIKNMLDFLDLRDYIDIACEITRNGIEIYRGHVATPSVAPHETAALSPGLPKDLPPDDVYVRFIYTLKAQNALVPKGHVVGFDQIKYTNKSIKNTADKCSIPAPNYEQTETAITITGPNFRYTFDSLTGLFASMVKNNKEIIQKPMQYNIWRALIDNDTRHMKAKWLEWGYDRARPRTYNTTVTTLDNELIIKTSLALSANKKQRFMDINAEWRINGEGHIACRMEVARNPLTPWLPRFGIRLFLPENADVEYLGLGPHASYVDMRHASWFGLFPTTADRLHEDHIRPQENGSRCGVRWVKVGSLKAEANETSLSFNASHYTQEALAAAGHSYELQKCGHIVLCLDYMHSGVGSGSCGPELLPQYRLDAENFTFELKLQAE